MTHGSLFNGIGGFQLAAHWCGSGTTGVACENLNRHWICIEKELEYCEIAKKRIEVEANQLKIGYE